MTFQACGGGDTRPAYMYALASGGLSSDEAYPYTSGQHQQVTTCCAGSTYSCVNKTIHIDGYELVKPFDEVALRDAVAQQPVAININASQDLLKFYSYGVYDADCSPQTDHGVLAVGYGA